MLIGSSDWAPYTGIPRCSAGPLSSHCGPYMGTVDYVDDPDAPRANSVVPSVVAVVTDDRGRVLLIHKTDIDLWALPVAATRSGSRSWTLLCAR